jgi:hypothetical protein
MPGYLVNGHHDAPMEIPGTEGRTVTFKSQASYGDDLRVDAVAIQYSAPKAAPISDEERQRAAERRTEAYVLARTAVMIVAWDLVDDDGQLLPVTAETLTRLTKVAGNFLATEARVRFEGRPEEAERPFESRSSQPSPAEGAKTRR